MGLLRWIKAAMKACSDEEKVHRIFQLNDECNRMQNSLKRKLNASQKSRIMALYKEKRDLMDFFMDHRDDPMKQMIVEQALKLVIAYMQLIMNYHKREKEISNARLNEILDRISRNNARLGHLKNYQAVLQLTESIELDEQLLCALKQERGDLERISAKLDYIESTLSAFKYQIMTSDCADPAVDDIEDVIREASALDQVLYDRTKEKMNTRDK